MLPHTSNFMHPEISHSSNKNIRNMFLFVFIILLIHLTTPKCNNSVSEQIEHQDSNNETSFYRASELKEKQEIVEYFKKLFLQYFNFSYEPTFQNEKALPQKLIDSFPTKSSNPDTIAKIVHIPIQESSECGNGSDLCFHLAVKQKYFEHSNHIIAEIYLPYPKRVTKFNVFSRNFSVTITAFKAKIQENGRWSVLKALIYYNSLPTNWDDVLDLHFQLNQSDFKNVGEVLNRGALTYIHSPVSEYFGDEVSVRSVQCMEGRQCCLVKTMVNFAELGWSKWIIKPTHFSISYCSGPCSAPQNHYTFHSNILKRMITVYGKKAPKLELCCAPYEMLTYSILHLDSDGGLTTSKIPDMEVKSCICG